MFLADVIGTVVSPIQHPVLEGERLLLLRPVPVEPGAPQERALRVPASEGMARGIVRVAVDRAQAGEGDRVLAIDEGNSGRQMLDAPDGPVKTVVVAVVDYLERSGEVVFDAQRDDRAGAL